MPGNRAKLVPGTLMRDCTLEWPGWWMNMRLNVGINEVGVSGPKTDRRR